MIDFTVLIPVFNTNPSHMQECIDSILSQTLPSQNRIVIVNDGSSDQGTINKLAELEKDTRFDVHNLPNNLGIAGAYNYGHGIIDTEYIALQGSDDISDRNRFSRQIEYFKRGPVDVLGTQLSSFWNHDPHRKLFFKSKHNGRPMHGNGWQTNHGTVIYRNQAVKDVGGYNEAIKGKGSDVDLFARMMKAGCTFRNMSENLYLWRRFKKNV